MIHPAHVRLVIERARDVADPDLGTQLVLSLVAGVEELLEALAQGARDPQGSARVTAAIAALGEMGVRLPERVVERLQKAPPGAS